MSRPIPAAARCPGPRLSRRTLLRIGMIGGTTLTLERLFELEAAQARQSPALRATAKSVIMLFQFGGPSHIDTFDLKPDAPEQIRGEFRPIPARTPGLRICEHLPKLAQRSHLYAVLRGVWHTRSAHNSAAYYALTGREPLVDAVTSNAAPTDFPHPGSVISYLDRRNGTAAADIPGCVSLPWMIADGPFRTPGEFAGFLGKAYDPLWILKDPNQPQFRVAELSPPSGVDITRLGHRQQLQAQLATFSEIVARSETVRGLQEHQARALNLLTSPRLRRALAIDEEPAAIRDRYGRTTYGQSVLLARRLVEAGVRFVTVYYSPGIRGWDTHDNNFTTLKNKLLPHTDAAVAALLDDLHQRGLLDSTIVYWTGDFGRTPKVNNQAGRDHWPQCMSVLLAGGGIRGGLLYGASDPTASFPKDHPVKPDDLTATLLYALGFDPATEIRDQLGRPMPIAAGQPIRALFG